MAEIDPNIAAYAHQIRTRVCGICIYQHKLLLVRHKPTINNKAFWAPPGGGLAYGEKITDCLKREFKEETGLNVKVGRFLFMNEFLEQPLHAIEYFFEVFILDGTLITGQDPEASADTQLIQNVAFLSLPEVNRIPLPDKHTMLHHLYSFDDLLGMDNQFL